MYIMYSAAATKTASGENAYGGIVRSSGSATATSDISESDALLKATLIAQNVANSQLQNDINIIDQSVDTAISFGVTGPTGTSLWQQRGSSIYYGAGNVGIEGKLGIGITGPTVALDVSGSLITTSDATINSVTVGRGGGNVASNTVLGYQSLYFNTTGYQNVAIGNSALYSNTEGFYNSASGFNSLYQNTEGFRNTAIGNSSLYTNTTGNQNVAIGDRASYSNTEGFDNTAIGNSALYLNTSGNENVAIGNSSLYTNTTGYYNSAIGLSSLYNNTTGITNTACGYSSLANNIIGSGNTAIGVNSMQGNISGGNNTAIGYGADVSVNPLKNCTSLGFEAICNASNEITLGNNLVVALRCQVQVISSLSDQRDKKDIENLESSLEFIEKLKPVRFNWNMRDGGKVDVPEIGFLAQDLQQVQKDTGITIPNLVCASNPEKIEASYGALLPLLVKSIQELSHEIRGLKDRVHILENK